MGQGFLPENKACDNLSNATSDWVDCNGVIDLVPGVGEANRLAQMGKGIAKGDVGDIVTGGTMALMNTAFDVCGFFTFGACKAPQVAYKVATAPVRAVARKVVGAGTEAAVRSTTRIAADSVSESVARKVVRSKLFEAELQGGIGAAGAIKEGVQTDWKYDREERDRKREAEALQNILNERQRADEAQQQKLRKQNNEYKDQVQEIRALTSYYYDQADSNLETTTLNDYSMSALVTPKREVQLKPEADARLLRGTTTPKREVELESTYTVVVVAGGVVLLALLLSEL